MTDYLTNDVELRSIANAIRTKGGTSESLVYPTGFVSAVNAIPSGGGGVAEIEFFVDFIAGATVAYYDTYGYFHNVYIEPTGCYGTTYENNLVVIFSMQEHGDKTNLRFMQSVNLGNRANFRYANFFVATQT